MAIQKGNGNTKKISESGKFNPKNSAIPTPANTVTPSQVQAGIAPVQEKVEQQRICFDLDKPKYRQLKVILAQEGITAADLFRNLLEEKYPELGK